MKRNVKEGSGSIETAPPSSAPCSRMCIYEYKNICICICLYIYVYIYRQIDIYIHHLNEQKHERSARQCRNGATDQGQSVIKRDPRSHLVERRFVDEQATEQKRVECLHPNTKRLTLYIYACLFLGQGFTQGEGVEGWG